MIRFWEGEKVLVHGRICTIKRVQTFDLINVQDAETGACFNVARADVHEAVSIEKNEVNKIRYPQTDEQARVRDLRFKVIEPALHRVCASSLIEECSKRAVEMGLLKKGDPSTIYDWKRKFEKTGDINSLTPPLSPGGGRGMHRLSLQVEDLMMTIVDSSHLNPQKKKPTAVFRDVQIAFRKGNRLRAKKGQSPLPTPCKETVFNRIAMIDPKVAQEKRYGKNSANERFGIMKGHLKCGRWPWELGQMDHKDLRVRLIDETTGEPIGDPPYLTVILDTNSRVPPGFIVSPSKPSQMNIGLCLAMSMIQKDFWLKQWGMDSEDFPVYGKWGTIQADNELLNEAGSIIEGCKRRGIILEFRQLRNPQSGGFIESLLETINLELRNFPGYIFKNRRDRENYDSEKMACFTLKGLTEAIAIIIIKIYCNNKHSCLQDSPLNTYKRNLITSGIGIPNMIFGEEARKLILDFMPFEERTVQKDGVRLFNTTYRSQELEKYRKIGKERM